MSQTRIGILIDGENVQHSFLPSFMELVSHNHIVFKILFGDFGVLTNKVFKETALKYNLECKHNYNCISGKNSSDIFMAIEAVNRLLTMPVEERPEVIYLCSSDSDFSSLALFIRNLGIKVIGVSRNIAANYYYVSSFNEYYFYSRRELNNIKAEPIGFKFHRLTNIRNENEFRAFVDIVNKNASEEDVLSELTISDDKKAWLEALLGEPTKVLKLNKLKRSLFNNILCLFNGRINVDSPERVSFKSEEILAQLLNSYKDKRSLYLKLLEIYDLSSFNDFLEDMSVLEILEQTEDGYCLNYEAVEEIYEPKLIDSCATKVYYHIWKYCHNEDPNMLIPNHKKNLDRKAFLSENEKQMQSKNNILQSVIDRFNQSKDKPNADKDIKLLNEIYKYGSETETEFETEFEVKAESVQTLPTVEIKSIEELVEESENDSISVDVADTSLVDTPTIDNQTSPPKKKKQDTFTEKEQRAIKLAELVKEEILLGGKNKNVYQTVMAFCEEHNITLKTAKRYLKEQGLEVKISTK